jgi:transketolase
VRTSFLKTLEKLAAADPRVTLVVGDLGFSVVEDFAKKFPRQFLNAGVAEQNMAGLAAGMALSGRIVFIYSIANFPTLRCLEQIRNDGCYHNANLKVVSVGGGFAYGSLGSSHHATEDLAIMRALPGMVVFAPGDPVEVECITRLAVNHQGPCYLRLGKAGEPVVHGAPLDFKIGESLAVRPGRDLTLISTGGMLRSSVLAAEELEAHGVSAGVVSMPTLKPIDAPAICRIAAEGKAILTVEEHSVIGGLGGAVAEVLAQRAPAVPFRILGIPDSFAREVGGQEHLKRVNRLSVPDIVRSALELRAAPREREVELASVGSNAKLGGKSGS